MNDFQVLQAITRGKTPSFPPLSKDSPETMRRMLEKLCRRCWAKDPAQRPTMKDIVSGPKPEALFLREDESLVRLVENEDNSKSGTAL